MGSYLDIFALVSHRSGISGGRKSAVQSIIFDDTMTHSQQERKKQRKPSKAKATVSIKCASKKKKTRKRKRKECRWGLWLATLCVLSSTVCVAIRSRSLWRRLASPAPSSGARRCPPWTSPRTPSGWAGRTTVWAPHTPANGRERTNGVALRGAG